MTDTHSLERTSPKGEPFLGTCTKCGQVGLPMAAVRSPCANPANINDEEALLIAIRGAAEGGPGPVAWMYTHHEFGKEVHLTRFDADTGGTSDDYIGWSEAPLYAHSQPDASALVEAIVEAALDVANVVSHDGYYEIDRDAAVRAALSAWEAQHG
ncbi:hypothetical protein [Blastomonas sp. UPD001]|uniref:hypothetical protein n=1 Tax=Blastomonas sp. UPD001 TaxID=2217673 RepID=UPI001300295D|nr:hypothetical protein [Blastomonas sp. UPD001]